jgi:peptidoglycan/xylan/chitin deacetylase (PgdA/CDA1 family)
MRWLAEAGTRVVTIEEAVRMPGAVALTFDDGVRNFREIAFPVLDDLHLCATVFVVTGRCGRTNRWPSQSARVPTLDLLSWSEIEELARRGVDFGAHTVTHPNLARLELAAALVEMHESRIELEDRTGRPVNLFAWPYGISTPALRATAAEEFSLSCGTDLRYLEGTYDLTNLPRIDAYYWAHPFWFCRQHSLSGRVYTRIRRTLRGSRSMLAGASPS